MVIQLIKNVNFIHYIYFESSDPVTTNEGISDNCIIKSFYKIERLLASAEKKEQGKISIF